MIILNEFSGDLAITDPSKDTKKLKFITLDMFLNPTDLSIQDFQLLPSDQ